VTVAWSRSLAFQAPATASNVYQNMTDSYGPAMALDDDSDSRWATDAGTHQAWLAVDLRQPTKVSRAVIDEAYEGRIQKFEIQAQIGENWQTVYAGETVGRDCTCNFPPVTTQHIRLNILEATEGPTIWEFQVY
jgi:alpha-L-fucosidase